MVKASDIDPTNEENRLGWDDIIEVLYDFSNDELRHLALECLLITDGPDKRVEATDEVEDHNQ
jgi:hypothetical protein